MINVSTIRRGIAVFAVFLFIILGALKWQGVEQKLLLIPILASGLLVGLLLITYRAFAGVVEAAVVEAAVVEAAETMPKPLPDDDDDEDMK